MRNPHFSPDLTPLPVKTVTMAQAYKTLTDVGLIATVEELISQADETTKIGWRHATELHRDSPTLLSLASQMGLTDQQLDALFLTASQVVF